MQSSLALLLHVFLQVGGRVPVLAVQAAQTSSTGRAVQQAVLWWWRKAVITLHSCGQCHTHRSTSLFWGLFIDLSTALITDAFMYTSWFSDHLRKIGMIFLKETWVILGLMFKSSNALTLTNSVKKNKIKLLLARPNSDIFTGLAQLNPEWLTESAT